MSAEPPVAGFPARAAGPAPAPRVEAGVGLEVIGVTKRYDRGPALGPFDCRVAPGSLAVVLGANGAGKSTLLGAIAGVLRYDGRVLLDGARPGAGDRRCAYLPQRARLPAAATVGETLALFRALAGDVADRIEPAPDFLPGPERRLGELSGGQAQRVALAAALAGAPRLILLDEPFSNLDDLGRAEALRLVRAHRDRGALVVIASPVTSDLLAAADVVLRVEAGRTVGAGTPG